MSGIDDSLADAGALFQIEEPARAVAKPRAPGRGIGIDLGTTHSLVAIAAHGGAPRVLDVDDGPLLASVVDYSGERPVVGRRARAHAVTASSQVVASVKRFMGRGRAEIGFRHPYRIDDDDGVLRLDVGRGRRVTPMEVSAELLAVLRARAEQELGGPVDGAVITVPAYFDDAQRQATKDAARIAGLTVYRLLAEPTAAALAYGLDRGERGTFAVFDLGGGTFDISVLRLHDGVFQVLATGGDSALGGDDFDRALAAELLARAGVVAPTAEVAAEALQVARAAKEALSDREEIDVELPRAQLAPLRLTRAALEAVIEPVARRTVAPCRRALADAGITADALDGVVLVGGSTRSPLVRRLVAHVFGREPLHDLDPDQVVAHGAAIQADVLSGSEREGITLLDVVPLSLGLETMGGMIEKIIPRNATIPIAARQVFTNYSEQQTGMVIHVVQGEREMVRDCRSLARFELRGIPRLPPSMARVEVTFQLDADALLTVTARELMTGVKQTVEIKPTHGLSSTQVDELVMESLDRAEDDFAARNLAEARVELDRVALAVRTALAEVGHLTSLLPVDERAAIEAALTRGDAALAAEDARAVVRAREQLESVSEPFARRRMERALHDGMAGRTVAEIEATVADEDALAERRGSHGAETIDGEPS
ncbi:MAG: Fe-S protein assembly chaperone HscA [Deltaproteobacteria bacterium]|nr:Fe-S protein assembly chaperone HscA [Deltaproteobacteria bacterium]MBK8241331.1 Fe-S protein assembly chaperone HscA [Deltaproteobacteria bacterium]MBK8717047.1 Fe-S protein assembly chaperone HscA [Deltaproteobacteria bacterium]MBP7290641.1 Fe-S protein assembly chaperone HscA [Nannocystaceae bacterium]